MITQANYFDAINRYGISALPEALKAGHEVVEEATEKGKNWKTGEPDIDELIDLQVAKLNEWASRQEPKPANTPAATIKKSGSRSTAKKAVRARPAKRSGGGSKRYRVLDDGKVIGTYDEKGLFDFFETLMHYEIEDADAAEEFASQTVEKLIKSINSDKTGDHRIEIIGEKKPKVAAVSSKKRVVPGRTTKKGGVITPKKKAVVAKAKKLEPKPGVSVKKLSAELSFIKSYKLSRGKNLSATSLVRRIAAMEKVEHTFTDHKTLLGEILTGYKRAVDHIQTQKLQFVTVVISDAFFKRCEDAVKNAKVKLRVDYLGGVDKVENLNFDLQKDGALFEFNIDDQDYSGSIIEFKDERRSPRVDYDNEVPANWESIDALIISKYYNKAYDKKGLTVKKHSGAAPVNGRPGPVHFETKHAVMEGYYGRRLNVGDAEITLPKTGLYIAGVWLKPGTEQRAGHGQDLYLQALAKYGRLYSNATSNTVSEDAHNVHLALEKKGLVTLEIIKAGGMVFKSIEPKKNQTKRKPASPLGSIATGQEIVNADYPIIDLGKYRQHFGEPAGNFDMMVFGEPRAGKTYYLLGLANHMAETIGRTHFVSAEEFGARTLADKIEATGATSPNLSFSRSLTNVDLKKVDFLFLDSINALKMTLDQYRKLRDQYPHLGVVIILQKTKGETFRGGKDWEHEVEICVEFTKEVDENDQVVGRYMNVYNSRYDHTGVFDI